MNLFFLRYYSALRAAVRVFNAVRVIHVTPGDTINVSYTLNIYEDTSGEEGRIKTAVDRAAKDIKRAGGAS